MAVIVNFGYLNHKSIMSRTGYSLGLIHSSLKKLMDEGFIDDEYQVTEKARRYMEETKPRRAVILAAGMGFRMTPINRYPKGLLQINEEPLIERVIKQLKDVGVGEIYAVVGYQMERLEYLTDKYGIKLIYNYDFAKKDSLHSLRLAADKLSNCYIIPCNIWFANNPFNQYEYFSWYAIAEHTDEDSYVRLNRKLELIHTGDEGAGNSMIGLCYLKEEDAEKVREQIVRLDRQRRYARETWEQALFFGNKMITYARTMLGQSAYEINTYEQLRDLDSESRNLHSRRIELICDVFQTGQDAITDISGLMKGMTNDLMRFSVDGDPYLLRVPGEGSNELTDRRQEAEVYAAIKGKGFSDNVIFISPERGFKITEFWEEARVCDPSDDKDVAACIRFLRNIHGMKLEVPHTFNLAEKLELYERLSDGHLFFSDYNETRKKIVRLIALLDTLAKDARLCHIDPVSDNFLFVGDELYLIDWEYAGMCDPHIDLAMFCIYANYDKAAVDRVADIYYEGASSDQDRLLIYAYAAVAGFLWAVWCGYKDKMGVNFSEYAIRQYGYAKEFYRHAMELMDKLAPALLSG
ncbi:MAG: phosphotransferase [Clostridiales bacterium]|nr:phosphotransferase [Clostridiales bacterium]